MREMQIASSFQHDCIWSFLSQNTVVGFIVDSDLPSYCRMQNWEKIEYCAKRTEAKHM